MDRALAEKTRVLPPALATEALSWAASVSQHLDPASIATFLERASNVTCTFRPRHFVDCDALVGHFEGCKEEKGRLATLQRHWDHVLDMRIYALPDRPKAMGAGDSEMEPQEPSNCGRGGLDSYMRASFPRLCESLRDVSP